MYILSKDEHDFRKSYEYEQACVALGYMDRYYRALFGSRLEKIIRFNTDSSTSQDMQKVAGVDLAFKWAGFPDPTPKDLEAYEAKPEDKVEDKKNYGTRRGGGLS